MTSMPTLSRLGSDTMSLIPQEFGGIAWTGHTTTSHQGPPRTPRLRLLLTTPTPLSGEYFRSQGPMAAGPPASGRRSALRLLAPARRLFDRRRRTVPFAAHHASVWWAASLPPRDDSGWTSAHGVHFSQNRASKVVPRARINPRALVYVTRAERHVRVPVDNLDEVAVVRLSVVRGFDYSTDRNAELPA